jgi:hypothetical protein
MCCRITCGDGTVENLIFQQLVAINQNIKFVAVVVIQLI